MSLCVRQIIAAHWRMDRNVTEGLKLSWVGTWEKEWSTQCMTDWVKRDKREGEEKRRGKLCSHESIELKNCEKRGRKRDGSGRPTGLLMQKGRGEIKGREIS